MLAPGALVGAFASGVSADGTVVLASESDFNTGERVVFIWSEADGVRLIPAPPGSTGFFTYLLSPDGRTVLGAAYLPDGSYKACVWSEV